jgi:hypothetical protein
VKKLFNLFFGRFLEIFSTYRKTEGNIMDELKMQIFEEVNFRVRTFLIFGCDLFGGVFLKIINCLKIVKVH